MFAPVVVKLAQSEWFTGKVTSCSLFRACYAKSGGLKDRLLKQFVQLCNEDTAMIRRACAREFGKLSSQVDRVHLLNDLMPVFRQLSQDEQDNIRVMCLESLAEIARHLSTEENQVHTLGLLLAAGEDKSWKVRL